LSENPQTPTYGKAAAHLVSLFSGLRASFWEDYHLVVSHDSGNPWKSCRNEGFFVETLVSKKKWSLQIMMETSVNHLVMTNSLPWKDPLIFFR
jgi:hypothetical protein